MQYHNRIKPEHIEAKYLLDILCQKINNGSPGSIKRTIIEATFKEQYPKSKKRFNDLTSDLTDFLNDFLLMKILDRDSLLGSMALLRYYHEHNLEKNYKGYTAKVHNMLDNQRDSEFHHHKYLLNQLEVMRTKDDRKKAISAEGIDEELELYYLENKLLIACEQAGRGNILNTTFDNSIVEYLLKTKYDTIIRSQPVRIYMWIYRMITARGDNNSSEFYKKIQNEIATKTRTDIEKNTLKAVYEYLMNECTYQINSGRLRYALDYTLYLKRIETMGILLDRKKISPVIYKNFITVGLIAQHVAKKENHTYTYSILSQWMDGFEDEYRLKINAENGKAVGDYCEVLRHIHYGAYKEANDLYSACLNTHDFYHDIACRKMQLQIAHATYESKNKPFIMSRISAFNKLIYRNEKLTERRKESLLAFSNYLRKIFNDDYKTASISELLEEMKSNLPGSDYIWFEKIIKGRAS